MLIDPLPNQMIPVLGFAAFSGTGKTSLLETVIPGLVARGLRVGLIKLSHHDFDIDIPGKDSDRLRKAGARQTLLASPYRQALICETSQAPAEPTPAELLRRLDQSQLDLVLVEGGRSWPIAKIELHRRSLGKPLLCVEDAFVVALASDTEHADLPASVRHLDIDNRAEIIDFIIDFQRR